MKTRKRRTRITATPAIAGKRGWVFCLLGALLLTIAVPAKAQCTAQNTAFQSGEHVMYDLYFNWKFIWKKVGLASLRPSPLPISRNLPIGSTCFPWVARRRISSSRCAIR